MIHTGSWKTSAVLGMLLISCVLWCERVAASTWQIYDQTSGLPGSQVTSFAVSKTQMAVGTTQGAAIYDAEIYRWVFPPLPDDIASAEIRDLAYDDNGGLWMATANGLVFLPPESEWARGESLAIRQNKVLHYGVADGLPNVDVERIQVAGTHVITGCFGGFVSKCQIPVAGKGNFQPVNYIPARADQGSLKINSVGITGLAMKDSFSGWFSTKGSGLVKMSGLSMTFIDQAAGLGSDWVDSFWIFPGESRSEHILAATGDGLTMLRDERVLGRSVFPLEGVWLTSLVAYLDRQNEVARDGTTAENALKTFLNGRSLWVGTKNDGLWRFADGEWTQFLPENSRLPSRTILRIYRIGGRLAVCTGGGLAIIPLNSQKYDEFKNRDLGRVSAKTIFPFPARHKALVPINHFQRKTDFWVASAKGLSRFVNASGLFVSMLDENTGVLSKRVDTAGLRETDSTEQINERSEGDAPVVLGNERVWDFFTRNHYDYRDWDYPLLSDNITRLIADESGAAWMIFDENQLSRLRMVPAPKRSDQQDERMEQPDWYHFKQAIPWSGGTKLKGLWFAEGQLYVGTETEGFFILKNPGYIGGEAAEWEWERFGMLEGLANKHVIGFALRRVSGADSCLAILHPNGLTIYNGKDFTSIDLGDGGQRRYRCIVSDPLGNLWMGTDAGVIRLTPDWKVITYTASTCMFESNKITALAVGSEGKATDIALWVACDQSDAGSDQPPIVITKKDASGAEITDPRTGKPMKVVNEADIDGASVHFFDGLLWEKWKIPGVRCMLHEGDYLWMGTNLRMRRFFIPVLLP